MTMEQEEIVQELVKIMNSNKAVSDLISASFVGNDGVTDAVLTLINEINEPPPPPLILPLKLEPPLSTLYVTQPYGINSDKDIYDDIGGHEGIDYRAAIGTATFATHPGEVLLAGFSTIYGNQVRIHQRALDPYGKERSFVSVHAHLASISVAKGEFVERGQQVGLTGNTGRYTTGPHLHYGMKMENASAMIDPNFTFLANNWVNPDIWLKGWNADIIERRVVKTGLRVRDQAPSGAVRYKMASGTEYNVIEKRNGWSAEDVSRSGWSGLSSWYSRPVG